MSTSGQQGLAKRKQTSSRPKKIKTRNKEADKQNGVTIIMILSSYKFYKMQSKSCTKANYNMNLDLPHTPSARKCIFGNAVLAIYKAAEAQSINGTTNYTIKDLCANLTDHVDKCIHARLRRAIKGDPDGELIRQLEIIYYNMVYIEEFRQKVFTLFESDSLDEAIISLKNDKDGARITQGTFMWAGDACIECGKKLKIQFRSKQHDAKGTLSIAYHKHQPPKICNYYKKKCEDCDILYSYNSIEYGDNTPYTAKFAKKNETIILDPEEFDYFAFGRKASKFIHISLWDSIKHHQYCNKSTSAQIWVQHYNEEWSAEYHKIKNILKANKKENLSAQLGYQTTRRSFYFRSLLCMIRDLEAENYKNKTITVNGHAIKIALIISNADKIKIYQDSQILNKSDSNHNDRQNPSKPQYIRMREYFNYYVNKYCKELINRELPELRQVPVKLNADDIIEIFLGWFVVYGDGNEKNNRPRCCYPAILAKLDYLLQQAKDNDDDKEDEVIVNDIEMDNNDIDLAVNHNSRLYSSQRYYECDCTPARNDTTNGRKSFKCCKFHTAKLKETYGFELNEIKDFIEWYRLHAALAKIKNTNVREELQRQYTIDEEIIERITTRQKTKQKDLEAKIEAFTNANQGKHDKFKNFVEGIYDKINSIQQKQRPKRSCAESGQGIRAIHTNQAHQQQVYEHLCNILGDDEFEVPEDFYYNTTSVKDLLALEFDNNKYLDKYKGCRKSKFISSATVAKTKGVNVLMNTAGIIINLREEIVRETPTAVILDIADTFTKNPTSIEYANRIEAIGYDMMCRIYHHLKSLVKDHRLTNEHETFWCNLISVAFIDIWHILTHTDELCQLTTGVFHPKSKKFEKVLYDITKAMDKVNDIIAEQFWSTFNATSQLKSMSKESWIVFLLEKRSYYNQKKIDEMKQDGWTFIPIEWCTSLRDIKGEASAESSLLSEDELKEAKSTVAKRVQIKSDKMQQVRDAIEAAGNGLKTGINKPSGTVIGSKRKADETELIANNDSNTSTKACANCGTINDNMYRCSLCKQVRVCSNDCWTKYWSKTHIKECVGNVKKKRKLNSKTSDK